MERKLKLNIGCGNKLLTGFHNIDFYVKNIGVRQYDLRKKLPYANSEVDEIICNQVLEHMSFLEEKKVFDEFYRILDKNGKLQFEVPDFDFIVDKWKEAKDDWIKFYELKDDDYFGHSLDMNHKHSVLAAHIFGNQSTEGNFHKNYYTEKKIYRILEHYNYKNIVVERFYHEKFTDLQCLRGIGYK